MSATNESLNTGQLLMEIDRALRMRNSGHARQLADRLNQEAPDFVEGWIAAARACQMQDDYRAMRVCLARGLELAPGSPLIRLMQAEALVHQGRIGEARGALALMEPDAAADANWLSRISETYAQCGDFADAERCARQAISLNPASTAIRYNFASALIATGMLEQAEAEFDRLIAANPHDYDAYYNRATLRKQSAKHNHVEELKQRLARPLRTQNGIVQLNYALAKELEDLERYDESFEALKTGADARRRTMTYDVRKDVAVMERIAAVFDPSFFETVKPGFAKPGPVFILGLPRSGTTLVDRILSAHSRVESLGELNDFAMELTRRAQSGGGKRGLVDAAARLDMRALGEAYVRRVSGRARGAGLHIDKAPANFLYIGLIAASLPNARIIHLNRDPMDNAFGMYKALFRMGYPYSYDFADLAAYMRAKDALMDHWRAVLPGRIIDVRYEDLVRDQEGETRRLLDRLDLDFEPACLEFYANTSATATASAAQVRQPIYTSAVGRWRRYSRQLAPLADMLGVSP